MFQREVAPGIHRVEDAYTNWYLVDHDGSLTVVDTGVPTSWASFEDALHQLGRRPDDVEAVVLTHGHFDHLGFAERARRELGAPVYVHVEDEPLTRKPRSYDHERARSYYFATQVQALPVVASLVRNRAWWPEPVQQVEPFDGDVGTLPVPGAPRVVFTPGHTHGHVALHFPERDAVVAGDAIVMFDPYRALPGPRIVSRAATANSERAVASLDALAATGASTVLTGHGEPWRDGAEAAAEHARAAGVG
jgi:glyoxylase-like metal-dependent hydrolase (beta-lactamase superfamily II)